MKYIQAILKKNSININNVGSIKVQIALSSYKISILAKHLKMFNKDHKARKNLISFVNKRKKLIKYFKRKNSNILEDIIINFNTKHIYNV